jgi:hypothetical protein
MAVATHVMTNDRIERMSINFSIDPSKGVKYSPVPLILGEIVIYSAEQNSGISM